MFARLKTAGCSIVIRISAALLGLALFALPAQAQDLTVLAAASLKEALDEVSAQFQRVSGNKVVASYAASSALAKQIENGAPADMFISADLDWMDYVEQRKLLRAGTRVNLLRNRLVLIAPAGSNVQVDIKPRFALDKLLGEGKLAMADPDSVPAGKYGKAALEKLTAVGGELYAEAQKAAAPAPDAPPPADGAAPKTEKKADVVDADFEVVDEDKNKKK